MKITYLVACSAKKREHSVRAEEIYISSLFEKARAVAKKKGDRWFILSAKHGLLSPGTTIEPYNVTLNNLGRAARQEWAKQVVASLQRELIPGEKVVFLAGSAYREFLVAPLEQFGVIVEVPMEGLRIGEQLRWLGNAE